METKEIEIRHAPMFDRLTRQLHGRARSLLAAGSSRYFRLTGVDATAAFDERDCVIVAPHCDDETLGCGVTIARKRAAGTKVSVVIVADESEPPTGHPLPPAEYSARRREEAVEAVARLGVAAADIAFLGYRDGELSDHVDAITDALADHVRDGANADVMVTSAADRHPDHAALGRAVRSLADAGLIAGELYEYAVWQHVPPWAASKRMVCAALDGPRTVAAVRSNLGRHRPIFVRTDGHLDQKRSAIAVYRSQLDYLPAGFADSFLQPVEVFTPVPVISPPAASSPTA